MPYTILIAGGTGLVGSRLAPMLRERGHTVILLSRRADEARGVFGWEPENGTIDDTAVRRADIIINLSGSGIADGRWTTKRRKSIIDSRVKGAHLIRDAILRTGHKPLAYLSASAIGYYGDPGEAWVRESDTPIGTGFKAETSVLWEQAAQTVADLGIPTFVFRIGIVLAVEGGALKPIIQPLRWGLGTYFADGQAWWSWVHRDDLCRMFCWAIENQGRAGIYNAVAPQPARNLPLTKAVAKAMRQWAVFLPVPAFMLRLVFGEMADVILDSAKVSAGKIEKAGFSFQFPDLEGALTDILR